MERPFALSALASKALGHMGIERPFADSNILPLEGDPKACRADAQITIVAFQLMTSIPAFYLHFYLHFHL